MKPVKTHIFNRRKYSIYFKPPVDGMTDTYSLDSQGGREISIFADTATKNGLVTLIHEALHAENWAASESVVNRVSTEIGTFLWRLGYRRTV